MKIWSEITVAKTLRYLFLLLSIGWGLVALLNLSACLGIFDHDAMMRGWVNFGYLPESSKLVSGPVNIFTMSQNKFAVINFDSMGDMLWGIPLLYLLGQLLSDLAIVLVFYQLMQIFRVLDLGDVFRSSTLARMRMIAYAVLTFSALTFLNSNLFATYINGSSAEFSNAYPAVHYERILLGALVALIITALLKAFQLGTQLQQEQDLTI